MKDALNHFHEMVGLLERGGRMYIQPFTYEALVAYLLGYDHATKALGHPSELSVFSLWIDKLMGHHCSVHWSGIIRNEFANHDDAIALRKFFEMFREFAQDRRELGTDFSKVKGAAKRRRLMEPRKQPRKLARSASSD